jgi:hypothetical protein
MKKNSENIKPEKKGPPPEAGSDTQGVDGKYFGGIGKDQEESSETENRKNVNADPNLIQGNRLDKEKK